MSKTAPLFTLSTALKPPKKFLVDGVEYDLLGIDHLDPEEENKVMALFARYSYKQGELESTPNEAKGEVVAEAMKSTRLNLISKLTTLPKSVAIKLPLSQQVALFEALEAEISAEADTSQDDEAAPASASGDDD